jgi:hypothetical protein
LGQDHAADKHAIVPTTTKPSSASTLRRCRPHSRWSLAVVRMSGQDRKGPVNLLQQHDSYELMGPGRESRRRGSVRALAHLAEAVGTADDEKRRRARHRSSTQSAGESLAGDTVRARPGTVTAPSGIMLARAIVPRGCGVRAHGRGCP